MSAVCVRARSEREHRAAGTELADLFCRQARLRAEALFAALWDNTDPIDVEASRRVVAGRYAFLEEGIISRPAEGAWVSAWEPGPATVDDVRRRIPPFPSGD
ncbi:hypothetical protein GCM10020358_74120 [Amorphoplanes nipponensis]